MLTEEQFKSLILREQPIDFCRRYLFDQSAWVFSEASGLNPVGDYQEFKLTVANAVNTSPNNVAIIGSGKYGFSMGPNKAFRPFRPEESDIDVVIVSQNLFSSIWSELRLAIHNGYSHLKSKHSNEIILRFVVLGSAERYNSTYLRETALTVQELSAQLNIRTRLQQSFKFRIYYSWSDVEAYHAEGVVKLREK